MFITYDTADGLIKGGPLNRQSDADSSAAETPGEAVLSVVEKRINRKEKRVDLPTLALRNWTALETTDAATAEALEKAAIQGRKDKVRDDKGTGNAVPDIKDRLDDLISVLQDNGTIPT